MRKVRTARRLALALPAVLLALAAGCATLPQAAPPPEAREPLEAEPAVREDPPDRPGSSEVRFDTEPEGAELLMDNRLRGTTPLLLPSLEPGTYKIEVRKPGYRTVTEWVAHAGPGVRYTLVLERLSGRLTVSVTPPTARVTLSGSPLSPGTYEVPASAYRVQASAFGYVTAERTVRVEAGSSATVELALDKAPFAARIVRISRSRIDPRAGGDFGRVRVDYEVTAPASGTVRVIGPSPKKQSTTASQSAGEIYAASLDAAAGPRGSVAWDGRNAQGAAAPEGDYLLRLDLRSADGEEAHLEAAVALAPGSVVPLAGQASGVSGLQYVATPDVAEPGAGAFTFTSGLLLERGSAIESAPVVLALRHGLSAGLELDAIAGAFLVGEPPLPYVLGAAVKRALPSPAPAVSLAATARASLQDGTGSDPLTAFTGLGLGLAAGVRAGPLLLTFEPELTASPWRVTGDDTYADDPAFNVWAYLRAGVAARLPDLTVGLSAAARTEPFADGAGLATPLALAAEARWSPAQGRLAIGLWAGAQVSPGTVDLLLLAADFGYRY